MSVQSNEPGVGFGAVMHVVSMPHAVHNSSVLSLHGGVSRKKGDNHCIYSMILATKTSISPPCIRTILFLQRKQENNGSWIIFMLISNSILPTQNRLCDLPMAALRI